jgi:predicted phage terminase large subunit-like protein
VRRAKTLRSLAQHLKMTKRTVEEKVADRKAWREKKAAKKQKGPGPDTVRGKAISKRAQKKVHRQSKRSYDRLKKKKKMETPVETEVRKEKTALAVAAVKERRKQNVIEQELARRELCRRRLIASTIRFNDGYMAGWVHKDICARLEKFVLDVRAGLSPRLMIQMPPRHGKSQLASIDFPAWVLGNYPSLEVILCSYAADLALDFSRAVRERLRDKEYQVIFENTRLDKDNQNAQGWKTTKKGGFLPAGVGGPITGKGAHILIIDDPIKNAEEAESETSRETNKRWYASTAYTRLAPGGGVLIIQTRWHDDDLSGWLERQMDNDEGDDFEIVRYPAVAVENEVYRLEGDALHEDRYPLPALNRIKKAVGPRVWEALYQQNPVPDDGAYFQRSMFQFYDPDKEPEDLTKVSAWDFAIGQKEQNDWTVGMTWGRGYDNSFYVLDMRRGRWDAHSIVEEMCDSYIKHKQSIIGIEKGVIATALGPYLNDTIKERNLYGMYVEELAVGKRDKVARARTIQGLMRQGRVFFPDPAKAPWVLTLMNEMLRFPHGVHDDIVDAMAWLGLMLTETSMPGLQYSMLPEKPSWKDKLGAIAKGGRNKSPMGA